MKKTVLIVNCILLCMLLTACFFKEGVIDMFVDNDDKIANDYIETTLYALELKDHQHLQLLFARQCVQEIASLDSLIDELFHYFNGEIESYDDWGGGIVHTSKEDDLIIKTMWSTLDIKTNQGAYRLMIKYVVQDSNNSNNIGIHSLYIINATDDFNTDFAYWGDGKDTPGINIGIKNYAKLEDMYEE